MSTDFSHAAFDAMLEGIVVHAPDGRIVEFNRAAPGILGLTEDQLLGRDSLDPRWRALREDGTDFPGPEHPAMVAHRTGRAVREVIMGVHRPDGSLVWLMVNAVPFDTDAGRQVVASFADVTEMTELRHALTLSEQRFRLLSEDPTRVVAHVEDDLIRWISPSVRDLMGWEPDEVIGRPWSEFIVDVDVERLQDLENGFPLDATVVTTAAAVTRDGGRRQIEVRSRLLVDAGGRQRGFMGTIRDVQADTAAEELEYRATHDGLTGLMTREEVTRRLATLIAQQDRGAAAAGVLVVAFVDVDDFKAVNDRYGHAAGDETLSVLARRLLAGVRRSDSVARLGGDEILAVFVGVSSPDSAARIGESLRRSASQPVPTDGGEVAVSASVGVTVVRAGDTPESVIDRADRAMYEAKAQGKDRVVVVS
jgi:diguanylate cyclase (GGDEF)-like protein/PAS domain S-box-containing protein